MQGRGRVSEARARRHGLAGGVLQITVETGWRSRCCRRSERLWLTDDNPAGLWKDGGTSALLRGN